MDVDPKSPRPRLVGLPGGRTTPPPQPGPPNTPLRFTPTGRCKESLWQALLSGVFYGIVGGSLFRVVVPSEEEKFDIQFKQSHIADHRTEIVERSGWDSLSVRLKHGAGRLLEPVQSLFFIGLFEFVRYQIVYGGAQPSTTWLKPARAIDNIINDCTTREAVSGRALIDAALAKGKHNPLRVVKFEAIPWPEITAHDIATIEQRQGERSRMMETGAVLAAGGAIARQAGGVSWSSVLAGAVGSFLMPFFVAPPADDNKFPGT